jgi:H+/Cl- antiporter ClcA
MKRSQIGFLCLIALSVFLVPALGYCSVESSMQAIQSKLIDQILPLAGVLGLCFAAFSFFTGNPGARTHLWMACIGACVAFGAPSIIDFIRRLVN